MRIYSEDEMLMLSGIQHFAFCRRQWVLGHMFGIWADNSLTIEGSWLHRNADDPSKTRMRDGIMEVRGIRVSSKFLGLYGVCDVVELFRLPAESGGVECPPFDGIFGLNPVEYKRGTAKVSDCDIIQLCAQAICLEEANQTQILSGDIYYGRNRRRLRVDFDAQLRRKTFETAAEMHRIFETEEPTKAQYSKKCLACSLLEQCDPKSEKQSAKKYLKAMLENEETS